MKAVAGSHELNVILKTAPTQPCLDHTFFWGRFVTALCGCLEWQWVEPEVVTLSYYLNQIVNAWVLLFLITPLLSFGFGLLFLRPVKTLNGDLTECKQSQRVQVCSSFFIYFDLSCHESAPWVFVRCPSCWWEAFQMNLLHESSTGQTEWSWKLRKPCCVADWLLFQGHADDCTIFLLAEPFYGGSGFCNHRHLSLAETFFRRCGCLW